MLLSISHWRPKMETMENMDMMNMTRSIIGLKCWWRLDSRKSRSSHSSDTPITLNNRVRPSYTIYDPWFYSLFVCLFVCSICLVSKCRSQLSREWTTSCLCSVLICLLFCSINPCYAWIYFFICFAFCFSVSQTCASTGVIFRKDFRGFYIIQTTCN